MPKPAAEEVREARERLRRFLRGETDERVLSLRTGNPSLPTEFCPCDRSAWESLKLCLRGARLEATLKLPFNRAKLRLLRRLGAKIGSRVHIAPGTWIDPLFPELLTIEDDVLVGFGARIAFHEFRRGEFRAGKVILRRGSIIGGFAVIGCGVEVGEGAFVAAGAVVGRDVPPGRTAVGNPARVLRVVSPDEPGAPT